MSALRRVGVTQNDIDTVYKKAILYDDKLFFKNFSRFFRKDLETVKTWTKTKNVSNAFLKLFNIFHKNKGNLDKVKARFSELGLIFEFYKKGEGQLYNGKVKPGCKINTFDTRKLRQRLTRQDKKAKYIDKEDAVFGNERVIWIQKKAENKVTNKFIKISKDYNVLRVTLSMDSKGEYYTAKSELEKSFGTYLDTPESKVDFRPFINFLKKGASKHFILCGCTYLDSEFRVTMSSSHNRLENVALLDTYKTKFSLTQKKQELFKQIRITYIDKVINKPIFITILTYKEGIFGAILLHPEDKGLTSYQRKKLFTDFQNDFGIQLNSFLEYKDLTHKIIYQHFLTNIPVRSSKIELRSSEAMSIYKSLLTEKILTSASSIEETSKICVNSTCPIRYISVWKNITYCSNCGDVLLNGKSVEIKKIEEENIANFLKNKFTQGIVNNSTKQLLSRKIFISQITFKQELADFIPITSALNDNQIEVLKYRYPHAIIITTRDDKDDLIAKGCHALTLWEAVYSIMEENSAVIKNSIATIREESLTKMRDLCKTSIARVSNNQYYKDRNKEVKNLGAELFEADCSILFDYVFGNCLWLGAKHRGKSLPDGFTAFPMLDKNKGCFIWDGKFSEGKTLVMGKFGKNVTYIKEAKDNKSIKDNGGLKGFVFISNNIFPPLFEKKYIPLTKNRRLKVSFIRASQFQRITKHFRKNEKLILNNIKAKTQFINSMIDLFFTTSKGRKCEIITDAIVTKVISTDENIFKPLKAGKDLKV